MSKRKLTTQRESPLFKAVFFYAQSLANREASDIALQITPADPSIGFLFFALSEIIFHTIIHKTKKQFQTLASKFEAASSRVSYFICVYPNPQAILNIVNAMQVGTRHFHRRCGEYEFGKGGDYKVKNFSAK